MVVLSRGWERRDEVGRKERFECDGGKRVTAEGRDAVIVHEPD